MNKKKFRSIRIKLVLILSFIAIVSLSLSSVAIYIYTYNEKKIEGLKALSELTTVIGDNLTASIEFGDRGSATTILNTLQSNSNIKGAFVYVKDTSLFSSYTRVAVESELLQNKVLNLSKSDDFKKNREHIDENEIIVISSIHSDGEEIGFLSIVSDTNSLHETLREQLLMQLIISFIVLIIITLLALKIQKIFTSPIFILKDAMEELAFNNRYDVHITHHTNDEFQMLFDGFETMIEKIQKHKETFEAIFKSSKDAIAILDMQSNFLAVNQAYSEMTGFSEEELLQSSCISLTIFDDIEASKSAMQDVLKFGYIKNFEKGCMVKDGKNITINMSMSLLRNPDRILINVRDITKNKELEQNLSKRYYKK